VIGVVYLYLSFVSVHYVYREIDNQKKILVETGGWKNGLYR